MNEKELSDYLDNILSEVEKEARKPNDPSEIFLTEFKKNYLTILDRRKQQQECLL